MRVFISLFYCSCDEIRLNPYMMLLKSGVMEKVQNSNENFSLGELQIKILPEKDQYMHFFVSFSHGVNGFCSLNFKRKS